MLGGIDNVLFLKSFAGFAVMIFLIFFHVFLVVGVVLQ